MNLLEAVVKGCLGKEREGGKWPADSSEMGGSLGRENILMWLIKSELK